MVFMLILARSHVTPRGKCVGRGASGQVLLRVLRFSFVTVIVNAPYSFHSSAIEVYD
jgi:hypothetical protein